MKKLLLIVLSAALVVGGGVYILHGQGRPVTPPSVSSQYTADNASSTLPEAIDLSTGAIANWSVCRNEKYGYEFKYPKGWHLYESLAGEGSVIEIPSCNIDARIVLSKQPSVRGGFYPPDIMILAETSDMWSKGMQQKSALLKQQQIPFQTQSEKVNGHEIMYYDTPGESYAAVNDGDKMIVFISIGGTGGQPPTTISLDGRPERILLDTVLSTLVLLK